MNFLETFISDVFQNNEPISRKSNQKLSGGRFHNQSTVIFSLQIVSEMPNTAAASVLAVSLKHGWPLFTA